MMIIFLSIKVKLNWSNSNNYVYTVNLIIRSKSNLANNKLLKSRSASTNNKNKYFRVLDFWLKYLIVKAN